MKRGIFRTAIISCLLITSLVFGGVSFADDGGLPSPGITPDSPFYVLDKMGKNLGMLFTFGAEAKANKALQYAEERLSEAQAMAAKNRFTEMTRAADDYDSFMEKVNERTQEAMRRGASDNVSERVAVATSKHLQVLDKIKDRVPEKAKEAVVRAKDASAKGQINALRALAKEKPERALDISSDAIDKLLERARARAAGNESSENETSDNETGDDVSSDNVTGDVEEALDYADMISALEDEMVAIAQAKGIDVTALQEKLVQSTTNRLDVLSKVYAKAPSAAKPGLENAIENSVRKYERAVEKVKEASPWLATSENLTLRAKALENVPEKFKERLELKNSDNATANVTAKASIQARLEDKVKEPTPNVKSEKPNTSASGNKTQENKEANAADKVRK